MNEFIPQSSGNEFDGPDFSNNLFTDLAPLLTLFGEQVTKQFLSQAMGYGDDILLAMAPLGIITCIISAIRAGGRNGSKLSSVERKPCKIHRGSVSASTRS
ncbi:hypothetical protein BJY04DRAFT_223187 [Aspergillus karnatakaensis]|uniref:uncharacterized protein n=1 Tax=Aspergillus karnatakaensis TaxID=1810916 RepID=UPI003CCD701A